MSPPLRGCGDSAAHPRPTLKELGGAHKAGQGTNRIQSNGSDRWKVCFSLGHSSFSVQLHDTPCSPAQRDEKGGDAQTRVRVASSPTSLRAARLEWEKASVQAPAKGLNSGIGGGGRQNRLLWSPGSEPSGKGPRPPVWHTRSRPPSLCSKRGRGLEPKQPEF